MIAYQGTFGTIPGREIPGFPEHSASTIFPAPGTTDRSIHLRCSKAMRVLQTFAPRYTRWSSRRTTSPSPVDGQNSVQSNVPATASQNRQTGRRAEIHSPVQSLDHFPARSSRSTHDGTRDGVLDNAQRVSGALPWTIAPNRQARTPRSSSQRKVRRDPTPSTSARFWAADSFPTVLPRAVPLRHHNTPPARD